ncbi:MAG: hypothetical protein RLZZ303_1691 [Candidatus Hydrogenedentota bacterium]|jgi:hypothetical protein
MPPATNPKHDIEAAVRRWNAVATASFPDLKDSLDDARGALTQLLRAFEDGRLLSSSMVMRQSGDASGAKLDELAEALAAYHVELRALAIQANRALRAGEDTVSRLAALSGGRKPAGGFVVPVPPELVEGDGETVAALKQRIAELEAAPKVPAAPEAKPAPKTMQDELVRLRLEVEELREENAAKPAPQGPPVEERIQHEAFDGAGKRRPMGLILLKAGLISAEQLELALSHQRSAWNRHLGSILVELGYVEDEAVARAIAAQTRTEFVRLNEQPPDAGAVRLISRKLAEHHTVIPIRTAFNDLVVAMANPLDLVALEDLKLASGRPIQPMVATGMDIAAAINRCYDR